MKKKPKKPNKKKKPKNNNKKNPSYILSWIQGFPTNSFTAEWDSGRELGYFS